MTFVKTSSDDSLQDIKDMALEGAFGEVTGKAAGKVEMVVEGGAQAAGVIKASNVADKVAGVGVPHVGGASSLPSELPIFEEKAITRSIAKSSASLLMGGGAASKIGGALGAKRGRSNNLELTVDSGDSLDVRQFSVREQLSSLFQINLVARSDNSSIDFDAVVGQSAKFTIYAGTHDRVWTGLCNHIDLVRVAPDGLSTYQISLVPTLWLLTQRKNYRMFQQISEPDIVLTILKEWDIEPDVRIDKAAYKKRKYRVQYAESDFTFISRMLEDAGITYFFELSGEETKLVLSDAPHGTTKRATPLPFIDDTSQVRKVEMEFVTALRMSQQVRPGKVTLRDHDYRRPPSYKLMTTASGGKGVEEKLEQFHYVPGAFLFGADQGDATPVADDKGKSRTDEKEGTKLAQRRLDSRRGGAWGCTFETNAYDLAPGVVMNVVGHPHAALGPGKTLLIAESSLSGTDQGEWSHHCEARGTDIPYRPEAVTPKPKVNGVESATVVGPPGEEIHTDEFGRARVHFHWDRESKMDDNSSCWIHVSQPWGGSGYGGTNLPRVGQEVLVDFLGGDPDRPIIVGRIYTNLQKTPYKLPENKTQSGWKSNSTGGGGGYNELMFEDAQGKELLRMQAEKDLKKLVKHDERVTIGRNRAKMVGANDKLKVRANRKITVGINQVTRVGFNDSTYVGEMHLVAIAPPSESACISSSSATMTDKKIVFDTGAGATITMEKAKITIQADEVEVLGAKRTTVQAAEGGVVSIKGGPMVTINTDDS